MSTFGDHTAKEDLYGWLQLVQSDHKLTVVQLVQMLAEIIAYMLANE